MTRTISIACAAVVVLALAAGVEAAEVCGDMQDNDGNGMTDEGCYPARRTGVCESPLSCMDTGWVSWSTGSLHYDVPADVAPKSPYGPAIGLRRFYTSMYAPPATPTGVNRTPLGARWQHNYMSWIDQPADPSKRVLHMPQGEDVLASAGAADATWQYFQLQVGQHVQWFRQRLAGAREYELRALAGETMIYDSLGQLVEVWDRVAAPNTNKVRVAWTTTAGGRAVSTVTDATGARRLRLNYAGAVLTSVDFQLYSAGTWTTRHTTAYAYASGTLASVTIGGQLAQSNTYSGGHLVQIRDGDNRQLATFQYTATKPGETVSIDTPDGTVGFEYNSSRATCTGKTVLYFNKGNATACSADADCGSGLLCGGKRTSGATGMCFRAARCLTVDSSSGESLVTNVSPLGAPGETCTGACAAATQYIWNTALGLQATRDALGSHVSTRYNSDGLPTKIVLADPDADPNNAGGARTMWLYYDPVERGRLVEIRRQTVIPNPSGMCGEQPGSWPCARTRFEYDPASGEVARTIVSGFTTFDGVNEIPFEHTTTRTYNGRGQLVQLDGPLTTAGDLTDFVYFASADPVTNGFLRERREKRDDSLSLTRTIAQYDFWGNATDWAEPDGTRSCRTYDAARGVLVKTSEEMNAANSSCATDDPSDLIERYGWDSNLRLVRTTRPDGSCTLYEYDAKGRLARSKRRDDCNPASAGPREDYAYDADGLLTEIVTYDAGGAITRQRLQSYYDSRQLQAMINPVDTSKLTALTYDARGSLTDVAQPGNLGHTTLTVDGAYQLTKFEHSRSPSVVDRWLLTHDAQGQRSQVTDPDGLKIETTYDDAGRVAVRKVPGVPSRLIRYDENGNVISVIGGATTEYTRDALGRVLVADTPGRCSLSNPVELRAAYDRLEDAPLPCPIAGGCNNVAGRLVYVRTTLMCSSAFPDGALDQWTFYSYDAAGRVVTEHITDDTGRVAIQGYRWTKNGDLASATMPSTATIGFTYGSAASNADTDRATAVWRMSPATPVIDNITWKPYGPVEQYHRQDTIGGSPLKLRMTYNLAYRTTGIRLDAQNGTGPYYQLTVSEDAKGRVTGRDYYPSHPQIPGVLDSYYLYDDEDRLLCESTSLVTSCPTSGSSLKNHMVGGVTGAGDRTTLLRPNPGSGGGVANVFAMGSHRVASVTQSDGTAPLGTTGYSYDNLGRRIADDNLSAANPNDRRAYTYDGRKNVIGVQGSYKVGGAWHTYYVASGFDARNRRVFKAFEDRVTQQQKQWFFYYDPLDRLTEVRYIPDAAVQTTFTTYQLFWLDNTLVAYWQTDSPSGTTTKRYVAADETGRPVRMHAWAPGNSTLVWAINPDAWGMDKIVVGPDVYQPIVFAGQYRDPETAAYLEDGVTVYRPALVLNGYRTYDPFTGAYLQLDPLVTETWSAYTYADNNPVGRIDRDGLKATERKCTYGRTMPDPEYPDAFLVDGFYCWDQPTGEWAGSLLFDSNMLLGWAGDIGSDRVGVVRSRDRPGNEDKKGEIPKPDPVWCAGGTLCVEKDPLHMYVQTVGPKLLDKMGLLFLWTDLPPEGMQLMDELLGATPWQQALERAGRSDSIANTIFDPVPWQELARRRR
jgi:RHS repeat-associated protein